MRELLLSIAFATVLFVPTEALACACCAEAGAYLTQTERLTSYDLEVIGAMKFGKSANLYLTEADFEVIKGLDAIKPELDGGDWMGDFGMTAAYAAKTWTFNLASKGGRKGTLVLPMPIRIQKFKVDIRDGREGGGGGPLLYKEFRFKGNVGSGTGLFRQGMTSPATYFLVFQGRGNFCDNTEDFGSWRLEINGTKAQYAFFGDLASGLAREN
jgi:hypothetical protein